jgi:hypothetical protein
MTNADISSDIYMKEPNENNQNIFQNDDFKENELVQMNQERYKTKLTLRKKKLAEKISQKRNIDYLNSTQLINNTLNTMQNNTIQFNFEKIVKLNESFEDLISKLSTELKDEEKITKLLTNIIIIIEQRIKSESYKTKLIGNIYDFKAQVLPENKLIEKLYQLILIYMKDAEIMELITRLLYLSTLFINIFSVKEDSGLLDQYGRLNKNGYFLSSDKYIDIYNKIFEIYIKEKNKKIIYFMVIFIANIAENEKGNQEDLCTSGTLNYVINSIDIENDNLHELDMKIWCLSKFDLGEKYNIDLELSLKIQKIYIEIYLNQSKYNLIDKINETMDENNFFYNFLKVIENLSYCIQVGYVEVLYKSNILEFLMDNVNNENQVMIGMIIGIFSNLTNADTCLLKRLIDIGGLKFLINILLDKNINNEIRGSTMVSINNLLNEPLLWNKVLFDHNLLKIFCVLLKDKNLDQIIFSEICYGIDIILPFCDTDNLKIIIDEYYIIQLLCIAMKNIIENNKSIFPNYCSIFINLIFKFLLEDNDSLKEDIIIKFKSINGIELIDQIFSKCNEMDTNCLSKEEKHDIENIFNVGQIIKDNIEDL